MYGSLTAITINGFGGNDTITSSFDQATILQVMGMIE